MGRDERKWTIWPTFVMAGSDERCCAIDGPTVKPGETIEVVPAEQLRGAVEERDDLREERDRWQRLYERQVELTERLRRDRPGGQCQ